MKRITIIIVVVILLAYLGASSYFATILMKVPRIPLDDSPASVGLNYEDVLFPSRADNITLSGWFIPGGPFTVIVVTGFHSNRINPEIGTLKISRDLMGKGFSVLLFDMRGCGESEGEGTTFVDFEQDIGGAIDYIKNRGYQGIGLLGFSLGAAEALIFASQENIAAVISDSSFANVSDMLVSVGVKKMGFPKSLVQFLSPGVSLMVKIIYGYKRVDPMDIVADISCPILFIHGEMDGTIPVNSAYELCEASNNAKDELLIVPGATHCFAYRTDPIGYIDSVTSFLKGAD